MSARGPVASVRAAQMSEVEVKANSKSMASFRSLMTYLSDSEIRLVGRTSHHGVLPIFGEYANPMLNECVQA